MSHKPNLPGMNRVKIVHMFDSVCANVAGAS